MLVDQITDIFDKADDVNFQYAKPALHWRKPDCCKLQNGSSNSNEYWDPPEGLFKWSDGSDENEDLLLSFTQLMSTMTRIRNTLSSHFKDWTRSLQPVVAISIPEGPYLPISILSVFSLNLLSAAADNAPVILPLDPDEGTDRLFQMLLDAKPDVIMLVRRKDEEKLNEALSKIRGQDRDYQPFILNVRTEMEREESIRKESSEVAPDRSNSNRASHIVYTSGTTGKSKGCISSLFSLLHYVQVKNESHFISAKSKVFLASALPFDPCMSDIIATFCVNATLCICPREILQASLGKILIDLQATHILCTPSLWSGVGSEVRGQLGVLEVVALGGEVMSSRVRHWWARNQLEGNGSDEGNIKLLTTYGVTEACVYQTVGEVFADAVLGSKGQDIGLPFAGLRVEIWKEDELERTASVAQASLPMGAIGEIVLMGRQLDEWSGYLNLPEAAHDKYLSVRGLTCYRTGDRGCMDPITGKLHIISRIGGEEGMIKIHGVRIELGEIENAILEPSDSCIVNSCVVTVTVVNEEGYKKLTAFCVLSERCLKELDLFPFPEEMRGILCPSGPLLALLRARCMKKARKGCMPSTFVIIERVPLTRTGKINRDALPPIETCASLQEAIYPGQEPSTHLSKYGRCGAFITGELVTCLNLHVSQQEMISTSVSFAILGGDSLAATRIARALYACHHGINNSRTLGGEFGQLEGAFNASHLIRAKSLGDYIDFLDSSSILDAAAAESLNQNVLQTKLQMQTESDDDTKLFEALLHAIMLNQSTLAIALLGVGAKPNLKERQKRLGKTSGRLEQRDAFKSNPMHLACAKGDLCVVRALLHVGNCFCKNPDSSGTYPIHLACSGFGEGIGNVDSKYDESEDRRRLECTKLLLDVGNVPLPMKNSSKQTVLHCAARGGYCILLEYLLTRWEQDESIKTVTQWGSKCDWQDRWFRTPVHWAVLHGKVDALRVLLRHGCSPHPPKPKTSAGKRTSGAVEFPTETCDRLYADTEVGNQMHVLLHA